MFTNWVNIVYPFFLCKPFNSIRIAITNSNIDFVHRDGLEDSQLISFNIQTEIVNRSPINSQQNRIKGKTLDCCDFAIAATRKFLRQNTGIDVTFLFCVFKKFPYSIMRYKRALYNILSI